MTFKPPLPAPVLLRKPVLHYDLPNKEWGFHILGVKHDSLLPVEAFIFYGRD